MQSLTFAIYFKTRLHAGVALPKINGGSCRGGSSKNKGVPISQFLNVLIMTRYFSLFLIKRGQIVKKEGKKGQKRAKAL